MSISREELLYIAGLARLKLREEEIEQYAKQLCDVLSYLGNLQEINLENVEAMNHVFDAVNVMREDKAFPPLSRETVLANAAEHEAKHFVVPRVIKDQESS